MTSTKSKMEKNLTEEERAVREDGLKFGDNFAAYSLGYPQDTKMEAQPHTNGLARLSCHLLQ